MKYENLVVHSTESELRMALGNANDYYTDKENPIIKWVQDEEEDEYLPHVLASDWVAKNINESEESNESDDGSDDSGSDDSGSDDSGSDDANPDENPEDVNH